MKYFVFVTSLALMAGTGVGYRHGKGVAQSDFMDVCTRTSVAVIYDHGDEAHRHFHCFELEELDQAAPPQPEMPADVLVL